MCMEMLLYYDHEFLISANVFLRVVMKLKLNTEVNHVYIKLIFLFFFVKDVIITEWVPHKKTVNQQ